jgi:hypothetical protein
LFVPEEEEEEEDNGKTEREEASKVRKICGK